MVRKLILGAAMTIFAADFAGAQITTYVAPPRPDAEARRVIVVADSLRRDSVARAAVVDMRSWVDSAAGVPVPSTVGMVDSAALADDPGRPITNFANGSVAPNTASALPTMVLIGVVSFALGVVLLTTRPRG